MNSKLQRDLDELLDKNIITAEVSHNIRSYYATKAADRPNRLFTIFGVFGALLVGLGIILILAHNWDDFSKTTKTIWAFAPLLIGQGLTGFSLFKDKSATWKEASGTFLFFAVGASLSLVSQIYNIPGEMSSFLLTWILLCAPLIYLLKSHALALLHLVFITAYACTLGYFDGDKTPWLYIPLFGMLLPYYLQLIKNNEDGNITSIFHWLLPISITISLGAFVVGHDTIGFLMYVALYGLCYNLGQLPLFTDKKLRTNGYLIVGSLGMIFLLVMVSFRWFWEDIPESFNYSPQDSLITAMLLLSGVGVLIFLFNKKVLKGFNLFQYAFLIFAAIFFTKALGDILPMVLTNLLVFALGIYAIRIGSKKHHFGILNYGLIIITVLIACRFFDTNIDFVIRGVLFLLLGVGFFLANYLMLKQQSKNS
ncbi:DUF2157 domain-containing protein [Sungkyunkwania multivorans]|uniref:DUF2157 domain-containing protein n=1 Tax=Sungkyunkwania multivorans TaxID=1173618 RepID=A0ABW3CU17_9FLAO